MKSPTAQQPRTVDPDSPIKVRGLVTDPTQYGFQILHNYESTYWRALVGNDAWSLYEVLRSFCHNGKREAADTCWPSINLLSAILGLKERRVITGYTKTIKGKQYVYPGLIERLQEHDLVIAREVGEGPEMRYEFDVTLTPKLMSPEQLSTLPTLLQNKHEELIERCRKNLETIRANRRPSRVEKNQASPENSTPKEGGSVNYQTPSVNYQGGSVNYRGGFGKLPTEQQQENNTQRTATSNNGSNNNKEASEQAVVVALLQSHGISVNVAKDLTAKYGEERIQQKVEYLEFVSEKERVKSPAGWLRKAIEEDYAAPDGFVSKDEREEQEQQRQERKREAARMRDEAAAAARQRQEQEQKLRDEFFAHIREQYGTTDEDMEFGEKLQDELEMTNLSNMILAGIRFLKLEDDTAVIGATNSYAFDRLQHPGMQMEIKRALKRLTKKQIDISLVQLELSPDSIPG